MNRKGAKTPRKATTMNAATAKTYRVGTTCWFNRRTGNFIVQAFLRNVDVASNAVVAFDIKAASSREAKKEAKRRRKEHERALWNKTKESIYRMREDDERFGLKAGDLLACESMHWAWASEKIAVKYRMADLYDPGCSQYRGSVEYVSGPRL